MGKNTKSSSTSLASKASQALRSPGSSQLQRSLAGSVLAQKGRAAETGAQMERRASRALDNPRSAPLTRSLAGSVVSQSNKGR